MLFHLILFWFIISVISCDWKLDWNDEFEGEYINTTKWIALDSECRGNISISIK